MTFRRRNRWFRRLAIGLAFATFAAPAAARNDLDAGTTGNGIDERYGPALPRQGEAQAGPDGGAPVSAPVTAPTPQATDGASTGTWKDAISLGLGTLALALALGLAVGYARRPRIAGL